MKHKQLLFIIAATICTGVAHGQALVKGQLQMTNANNADRRISGIGTPVDTADAISAISLQQGRLIYAVATGTANSLFVNIPGINSGYRAGTAITFRANATNTGTVTLNVNGWGPKNVYYNVNNPLTPGDILTDQILTVIYDGANFQVYSPMAQQHNFSGQLVGDVIGGQNSTLITTGAVTTPKLIDSVATPIKIKGRAVNTVHMVDSVATSVKIKGRAVNTIHLADSAVTADKIKSFSVANVHFVDSAVTAVKIKSVSVANVHLMDSAVTSPKIKTASVMPVHMVDSLVVAHKLKGNTVNTVHIADNAVNSAKIADGSITNTDIITTAAIPYSKLALNNAILAADFSNTAGIAYSKLALGTSLVNTDFNTTAQISYSKLALATSIKDADIVNAAAIPYSKLNLNNSIQNGDLAANSVTLPKITTSGASNGYVLKFNSPNIVWSAPSAAISSLNGETGATQTMVTGTAGTDFNITHAGNVHTFNLPNASGTTARGAVSTGAQTFGGNKTFSNNLVTNGNFTVGANKLTVDGTTGNTVDAGRLAVGNPAFGATTTALEINSVGTFVLPRLSATQVTALGTPAVGSMIYNTTANTMQVYTPLVAIIDNIGSASTGFQSTGSRGQTFTAPQTGQLSAIGVYLAPGVPGDVTATLYSSVGGSVLGTSTKNVSGGATTYSFDFSVPINNGTQYYVEFTTINFVGSMGVSPTDNYSGGEMYLNGAMSPSVDLYFKVSVGGWTNF